MPHDFGLVAIKDLLCIGFFPLGPPVPVNPMTGSWNLLAVFTLLMTTLIVMAAVPAAAQLDLVPLRLDATAYPPNTSGDWDGSQVAGNIEVELCTDEAGGFNPLGGGVSVSAQASGPGWVTLEVSPESIVLTPPMGPEAVGPGCMQSGTFTITLRADNLYHSQPVDIEVTIQADAADEGDGDVPVPADGMGTYQLPQGTAASFSLSTVQAPPPVDEGDDDRRGTGGVAVDTNQSPLPLGTVIVVFAAMLLALRRGR